MRLRTGLFLLAVFSILIAFGSDLLVRSNFAWRAVANAKNNETSMHLRRAGTLNYEYDPGVILPLRNGKILAFDGMHYKNEPERFIKAEDGNTYGYGYGMIELFDPASGQTKVQTKMPFWFERDVAGAANRRQVTAIELADGRIFLVGKCGHNPTMKNSPLWSLSPTPVTLPILSASEPKYKLKTMAPDFRQTMFGLIYDPRNFSFEAVDYPPSIPPRWFVAMNLLPDGQVLITGGCVTQNLDSWKNFPEKRVLCFNPKSKTLKVVGELQHARFGHEVVPLSKSQFMLINGYGISEKEAKNPVCSYHNRYDSCGGAAPPMSLTHEVEIFDLSTKQSKITGHTLTGRYDFSAIHLPDQTVFIHGGAASSLLGFNASELYNPKTGLTSYIGEPYKKPKPAFIRDEDHLPYRLLGEGIDFRGIRTKENRLVLAGKDAAYVYDWQKIKDRQWLQSHHVPMRLLMPRIHHHIVENSDKRLFVIGGLTYSSVTGSSITRQRRASLIEEFIFPE